MDPETKLMSQQFDLNQSYEILDNLNPILFAAKHGLTQYIELKFAMLTADNLAKIINNTNPGGLTALHFAARYGRVETVECLLKFGASRTQASSLGYLPIHSIFNDMNKHEITNALFLILLEKDGILSKTQSNENIAHLAASRNNVKILEYIQAHTPQQFNCKDNESLTPLLKAVLFNQMSAVAYLLKHSDINITNSKGQNALHIAALHSSKEMLLILLPHFNSESCDNEKRTVLDCAQLSGNAEKISVLSKLKPIEQPSI